LERTELSGKCAVITGAGTGIGQAIALALAARSVKVLLVGRRRQPIEDTARLINSSGGKALWIQADVSQEHDVNQIASHARSSFGVVDILVNNAGISGSGEIHEHDVHVWDRVMATNLRGPFLMCRAFLSGMRAQRYGHIVNISSESGLEYYLGNGAYGVSKHALNALGEYIQRENQEFGIRIDTICPGMVVTPMSDNASGLNREKCLSGEDIADLTIWLLTRRANVKIGRPILIQTMENPWQD
jgi:NAD(P)-dependent dehydrogenase (short-subunit alcohol dehydrogenase family)